MGGKNGIAFTHIISIVMIINNVWPEGKKSAGNHEVSHVKWRVSLYKLIPLTNPLRFRYPQAYHLSRHHRKWANEYSIRIAH